jgi:hypothetical protein
MEIKKVSCGELKIVDGAYRFAPGYFDNGLAFGNIYKDVDAYEKDWDAVCYIPEHDFDDVKPDEDGFFAIEGYTHNDLLDLCFGNREWCDYLFHRLEWACPETYINEFEDEDIGYFYRFLKKGAKVWWNDPEELTSGEYTVFEVPFEFNEHGEPIDPDDFSLDTVVLIGNDHSEAEVPVCELIPIYTN